MYKSELLCFIFVLFHDNNKSRKLETIVMVGAKDDLIFELCKVEIEV